MGARTWNFFRAGGFDQVRLSTGADLVALDQLDQKLWVALACPTKGLEFDARTLELIDTDKDGRIRAPELIAAIKWAAGLLKDVEQLAKGSAELPLTAITEASDEGKALLSAAKTILEGLGKKDAAAISVADMAQAVKAFEQMPLNGDGVVPADAASDPELKKVLEEIVATQGGAKDKSGKVGVDKASADKFFAEVAAHAAWLGKADKGSHPLAEKTAAAHAALAAVRTKVDDFFARGRLLAFDARAEAAVQGDDKLFATLAAQPLSASGAELAAFPLTKVGAGKALPLTDGLNPAYAAAIETLRTAAVEPLLGKKTALTAADWAELQGKLAGFEGWQGAKAGASVEPLGADRVKALAAKPPVEGVAALIAKDAERAPVGESIAHVEKLVRYSRDLLKLANNFVSFRDFYTRADKAVFQAGRLYLDQRACDLVLRVTDAGKHASMAPLSRTFLVYCDCKRPGTGETMTIAAAMTAGDVDNLMVGRNGLFYDRAGNDWDATVTRIVDNPISIRQAFWTPYKKVVAFVEDQVQKRIAAADAAGNDKLMGTAQGVAGAADSGKPPEAAKKPFDVGVVAALGVAVGGITAALGAILQAFFGLGMWMPIGVVGAMLLVSGPSMLLAWLKLRQRNLGPLLDANGWALNAQALVNVPFGGSLTTEAELPAGSSRDLTDPFAEKERPWKQYATVAGIVLVALLWYVGSLDGLLPGPAKSTNVLGAWAPASDAAASAPEGAAK